MLTSKQRAALRSMSNEMDTIMQVGKGGIGEELIISVNNALEARELIKMSVLDTAPVTSREAADQLAEETGADVVSVVGRKFVLYRESKKKKRIIL
ncbi:MAG: ribosome assembly RNA-binding protein YhbY [Ruminococcaceae bacterium]|nr:ribosome assembly RNA-binding protein YhbY [Oscillospiraceae bacterium]